MLTVRSLLPYSNTLTCLILLYIYTSLKCALSAALRWVLVVGTVGPALQHPKLLMGLFKETVACNCQQKYAIDI